MRRFPAPWTVEALDGGGFKIVDWNGQSLAYVYGHADPRDAQVAKSLTLDEARRIASNIAKLPTYSAKTADGVGFGWRPFTTSRGGLASCYPCGTEDRHARRGQAKRE